MRPRAANDMQPSMFNVQVPLADGSEVFLMNTFTDAQVVVSSDVVYPTGSIKNYETNFWLPFQGFERPVYAIPGNRDWYDALEGFAATFFEADAARATMRARVELDHRLTSTTDARIGWLLAMSRLHHPDPSWGDGRQFAAALGEAGMRASRSLVSRWESGEIPISYEAMAAYERVLGLPTGQIASVTAYIRASLPGVKTRLARPRQALPTHSQLIFSSSPFPSPYARIRPIVGAPRLTNRRGNHNRCIVNIIAGIVRRWGGIWSYSSSAMPGRGCWPSPPRWGATTSGKTGACSTFWVT